MKRVLFCITLSGMCLALPVVAAEPPAASPATEVDQVDLKFDITQYIVDGATLLKQSEIDVAVAPYLGKKRDFSDVQRALEAIEAMYAKRGYSAVRVLLPEQELEKGVVHFHVVESHFGKVEVKDNRFFTADNVMNALPSVRSGSVPRTKLMARELKLANENPARQLNTVLKAGAQDDLVDARIIVTDSNPVAWGASFDNTGSAETGFTRLGLSYRNANLFDEDHVVNVNYVTSPQHPNRVQVLGLGYRVPLYRYGNIMDYFVGYSNVNAVVGGLSNFQGGGLLMSMRYTFLLERMGRYDPRVFVGLDRRDFKQIELTGPSPLVMYNRIVVLPVSAGFSAQAKYETSDVSFNASYAINIPGSGGGANKDFATYNNLPGNTQPAANYKVLRYGATYAQLVGADWQLRANLTGQWTRDVLIQGEQIRLGGADAVRGFSEGSEGGGTGERLNLEAYTPDFGRANWGVRALAFYDVGKANPVDTPKVTIAGAGLGLRVNYTGQYSMRLDWARITNAGTDIEQQVGDTRWHASLNASF